MHVTKWREGFVGTVEALHALRTREANDKRAAEVAAWAPLATRVWAGVPKTPSAGLGLVTWSVVRFYKFVTWAVRLYMAAHMFFRAFLADPFSSFSGRGAIEHKHLTDHGSPPPPPPQRVCMISTLKISHGPMLVRVLVLNDPHLRRRAHRDAGHAVPGGPVGHRVVLLQQGRAVQVDPVQPMLKASESKLLKL